MPNSARSQCIASAVSKGLTQQEATSLVDFIARAKANGDPAVAAATVGAALKRERLRAEAKERRAKLNAVKREQIRDAVDAMVSDSGGRMSEVDALTALLAGTERRVQGGRRSAQSYAKGMTDIYSGRLIHGLEELGVMKSVSSDKSFSDNVIREMRSPGTTGDPAARAAAQLCSDLFEEIRVTLNREGADIAELKNYCPQAHDSDKIREAGMAEWIKFVHERIDWDRTMPEASPEEIAKTLENIYYNIVTGMPHKAWKPDVNNPRGVWDPNNPDAWPAPAQAGGKGGKAGGKSANGADAAGAFGRNRNLASPFEHSRILHFKDADAAVEYNTRFGKGTVFESMSWHLNRASQSYGVLRTFGTDAAYNIQWLLKLAADRAKAAGRDGTPYLNAWGLDGTGKVARLYKDVAGEVGAPSNITLARIGSVTRAVTSMSKLGSALLASFPDFVTKGMSARHAGAGIFEALRVGLSMPAKFMQSAAKVRLGRQLGVYVKAYTGEILRNFDAADSTPGVVSRLLQRFFKLNGLTGWTEAHRSGYTFFLSNELAHAALEGANDDFRVVLERHGMADKIGLAKHMIEEVDGEKYVIPENVKKIPEDEMSPLLPRELQKTTAEMDATDEFKKEAQRLAKARRGGARTPTEAELRAAYAAARDEAMDKARRDLMMDFMAFYSDETGYAVLEPDSRARAVMYQGTRAGTPVGEMLRLMMQFKAFPVTFWQRWIEGSHWQRASRQVRGGMRGFDWRNRFGNDLPGLFGFMISSMAMGYLAMTAKDLTKGKNFRDPKKASTWAAALVQSGGLGIMGDFFLGTADRFGGGATNFAAGPFLSDFLGSVPVMTGMAARGEFADAAETGARLLMNNMQAAAIPLAKAAMGRAGTPATLLNAMATIMMSPNLWYTRAAFDYGLGFHIREMINPGSLRRMESKIRHDNNQTYIIRPSDIVKRGGGFRGNWKLEIGN